MNVSQILLVEDDELTQILLKSYLEKEAFEISVARSAGEMTQMLAQQKFTLIILDLGLPDEDGLVLIRQIRMVSDIPIVVITSRSQQSDRNAALKMGADDYLAKPFDPLELVLRLQNIIRRTGHGGQTDNKPGNALPVGGGWSVCLESYSLKNGAMETVRLTQAEFNILTALARAPGRALTRAQLLDATAHFGNDPYERTVDVLIGRLRRKLEAAEADASSIRTIPGIGYMLAVS